MSADPAIHYFAYGSNLHPERLRRRIGRFEKVGVASLAGYRLRFHKRGVDGSGKCNVDRTGEPGDRVLGVIYRLAAGAKGELDRLEGVGFGYSDRRVGVGLVAPGAQRSAGEAERLLAWTYVAERHLIDDRLRPFGWYQDFVVAGARHHRLPADYIEELVAVAAIADPRPERARRNRQILGLDV